MRHTWRGREMRTRKLERKRRLGKPRHRWKELIKMNEDVG